MFCRNCGGEHEEQAVREFATKVWPWSDQRFPDYRQYYCIELCKSLEWARQHLLGTEATAA